MAALLFNKCILLIYNNFSAMALSSALALHFYATYKINTKYLIKFNFVSRS
jgi:hypothetical protein